MNINQEIEKEEMKVQNLVKDWHSQKLVSFIDDLIKKDRAEQLILSSVSHRRELLKGYAQLVQSDYTNHFFDDAVEESIDQFLSL